MKVLITGGAGFIGCHLAHYYLNQGADVTIYDNLSRSGTPYNLEWLKATHPNGNLTVQVADICDYATLKAAVQDTEVVFHMAAQVAVTSSVVDPRTDFEINALGAFNVLEAIRETGGQQILFYASTNKVYGGMEEVRVTEMESRYKYEDYPHGVPESFPLDFHSPYGCSKGSADQYVRDYARIYGIRGVVFRQSCIYGTQQFGNEDQGWVAHFVIANVMQRPITIFGNGKQVRDLLFIEDLVQAFDRARQHIDVTAGQVYNIGGGPENSLSIWAEFSPILEQLAGRRTDVPYGEWRPGDQQIYVSDIRKAERDFGWTPQIAPSEGIERLYRWVRNNIHLFTKS